MNKNILGGITILLGIALLLGGVLLCRDGMPGGLTFKVQFKEAKGLKPGDFVYQRGVSIGEIQDVGFENGNVVAAVRVYSREGIHVAEDSYVFIWTDQLLTDRQCIIVEPGNSSKGIERGALVQGESSKVRIMLKLGPKRFQEILDVIKTSWENRQQAK